MTKLDNKYLGGQHDFWKYIVFFWVKVYIYIINIYIFFLSNYRNSETGKLVVWVKKEGYNYAVYDPLNVRIMIRT